MNLIRTILLVTAVAAAVAVVAPVGLAGSPTSAEQKALEIRGKALNQACADPTTSRAAFRALCTYTAVQSQPTPAELHALETRGEALNQACVDPTSSRDAFRALCTYAGALTRATPVEAPAASDFAWRDFGIGAGAMLGLALVIGGTAAALHFGRTSRVQPRAVS